MKRFATVIQSVLDNYAEFMRKTHRQLGYVEYEANNGGELEAEKPHLYWMNIVHQVNCSRHFKIPLYIRIPTRSHGPTQSERFRKLSGL